MERKGRSGGDRERGKRKGAWGGAPCVPASPPRAAEDCPGPIVLSSPPFSVEGSPGFAASVRCARALLMLSSLRSSSSPIPVEDEWRKRDLEGAFTAVEAELAEMRRRTEELWRVLRIAVALQVLLTVVLCALIFRLLDIDCPASSYYPGHT